MSHDRFASAAVALAAGLTFTWSASIAVAADAAAPSPPAAPVARAAAAPRLRQTLDVQVDPTPFFLRGFAPEIGYSIERHRVFATVIAYDVPSFLREDKQFAERRNYILGLGYEMFFRGHLDGPFASLGATLTNSTFSVVGSTTGAEKTVDTFKAALRVGWVIHPLPRQAPRLFIGPWLGAAYALDPSAFTLEEHTIHRRAVGFAGALQLGWALLS
jgi:hypothetical protein